MNCPNGIFRDSVDILQFAPLIVGDTNHMIFGASDVNLQMKTQYYGGV